MIQFMSKAAASFVMTDDVAKQVFTAVGSDFSDRGIWTVERLPEVRQRLEQLSRKSHADEQAKQAAAAKASEADDADDRWPDERREQVEPVILYQRVTPVIDMLRRAEQEAQPIVWERL